jgi:GNAT superfamily N-acetyltransferase
LPTITPEILAIAEMLAVYLPLHPGRERVDRDRFSALIHHRPDPHRNVVLRVRVASGEVETTVAEVRALYRARGTTEITWEVGPSSTPPDLAAQLLALGMVPDPAEPELAGMVLAQAPAEAGAGVRVERVRTLEGFRAQKLIYHRCFEQGAAAPSDAEIVEDFERRLGSEEHRSSYLAFDGDVAVAAADAILVDSAVVLTGGATLPEARGRGVYRALVQRRWEEAVARGTPVLVVQAGGMSRPILERLGFVEVTRVKMLRDRFG